MPNSEFLRDLIMTVVFLIPVLGLVWKGATLAAELKALKDKVEERTNKFCHDYALLQEQLEQERVATDSSIAAIMSTLTEIQKSIVRVETKLDTKESK